MCLAFPGEVVAKAEPVDGLPMGIVAFGGVRKEVCLACTPDANIGDYVLVHAGFAISTICPLEALRCLETLSELEIQSESGAQ